jgi:hypothetical protein
MARIPLGNQGYATPGRVQQAQAPAAAFGAAEGRAIEQLGQVGVGIATDAAAQQTRQEMLDRDRQANAAEAAERAREALAIETHRDSVADLKDEIANGVRDGKIPKDKAEEEWSNRSKKLTDATLASLRPESRELAGGRLAQWNNRGGNDIRKARETRDRQDVTTSLDGILEAAGRSYAKDPVAATAMVNGALAEIGPQSLYTPEQLSRKGQQWREGAQFTQAYSAVSAAAGDRKSLDSVQQALGTMPDLDPQKRATLETRIDVFRARLDREQQAAADRAAAAADRRLKVAEAGFTTFQSMTDKGTKIDPAFTEEMINATAGTPYQAGIRALAKQSVETGGLAAQPIAQQKQALQAIDQQIATNGRTPELDKRRSQIEKVARASEQDAADDPMRASLERGVVTNLPPLDMVNPSGLAASIAIRTEQAARAAQWTGRPASPLTNDEAVQVGTMLDGLAPKEKSVAIAALAKAIGPQASQGMAAQLDKKDKALGLAFAFSSDKTTEGRYTSELVLRGEQAKKDGTSTKGEKQPDLKVAQWSAFIASELDGVYPTPTITNQTREAAILIAHGIASEQGGSLSTKDLERATRLAMSGSIVEHNGRKVALPAGVDQDMLDKRLESITPAELGTATVRAGGMSLPAAEFLRTLPGQQLMYVAPGKFAVLVGGRPVTNEQGRPVIVGIQ